MKKRKLKTMTLIISNQKHGISKEILISAVDYKRIKHINWVLWKPTKKDPNWRVYGWIPSMKRSENLARFLLGLKPHDGLEAEHWNQIVEDHTRENLRVASQKQNSRNKKKHKGKIEYKGVRVKIRAEVFFEGYIFHLGEGWKDIFEASIAYDIGARRLHGDFCSLNHPDLIKEHKKKYKYIYDRVNLYIDRKEFKIIKKDKDYQPTKRL